MRFIRLIFALWMVSLARGADPVVELAPVQVQPSQMYYRIVTNAHDEIEKLVVISVEKGSQAERLGIQKGDLVTAENGMPIAGRKKSAIVAPEQKLIVLRGLVTFEGVRGFFHTKWSLTIDAKVLRKKNAGPDAGQTPTAPNSAAAQQADTPKNE